MAEPSTAAAAAGDGAAAAPGPADTKADVKERDTIATSLETYTYKAPWDVYALAASNRSGSKYAHRYALGSFIEEYNNKVQASVLGVSTWRFMPPPGVERSPSALRCLLRSSNWWTARWKMALCV